MKVTIPLALVLILAATTGYLVGTESGRQRRELILVKLGRARGEVEADVVATEPDESGE